MRTGAGAPAGRRWGPASGRGEREGAPAPVPGAPLWPRVSSQRPACRRSSERDGARPAARPEPLLRAGAWRVSPSVNPPFSKRDSWGPRLSRAGARVGFQCCASQREAPRLGLPRSRPRASRPEPGLRGAIGPPLLPPLLGGLSAVSLVRRRHQPAFRCVCFFQRSCSIGSCRFSVFTAGGECKILLRDRLELEPLKKAHKKEVH